jgi:excisionase family DNA binding protein
MSLEESVRIVVREEMQRVLRQELGAIVEAVRSAPKTGEIEFLSVAEAAQLAQVSEATVREWMTKGLKRYGQGRVVRIRRPELLAFLSSNPESAAEEMDVEERAVSILSRARAR